MVSHPLHIHLNQILTTLSGSKSWTSLGCQEKQVFIKWSLIIVKVFVLQKSIKIFICFVMTAISYSAKLTQDFLFRFTLLFLLL